MVVIPLAVMVAFIGLLFVGASYLGKWIERNKPTDVAISRYPTHICGNCRTPIWPIERAEGNGAIEVLLWLFFLVPGIIYSIWRASTRKPRCPICAAPHPIPLGTPAAEALIAR